MSKLEIPLNGRAIHIVGKCGASLTDILESKFGCVATIDGVDFEKDQWTAQPKRPHIDPEKRYEIKLPSGVSVSVWKADLTDLKVDAVVNAANERLKHIGGLALALSEAGGPQIQKQSDDYIQKNGDLNTGDAIVTDAGSLRCKMIIHAVGPQLTRHPSHYEVSKAEPQLQRAIGSILYRANEYKLKTVAIPAISSGLFNYPLQQCAETIVKTIDHYYKMSQTRRYPEEIMLVNNDEPTVMAMERACCEILAPHPPPTYSQAAASKSGGDGKTLTVQMGKIHLTLKKGRIEEQKADVIVNSTYSRDLSAGEISNALLMKAGYEMQKAMNTASMSGYVAITKGYRLDCKEVYHTCCVAQPPDTAKQVLFNAVSQCLWLATKNNHISIAFPAIGTGGLKIDKKEAARAMSRAVYDFSQNHHHKIEVYFVIHPSDSKAFQAFEERLRYIQKNETNFSFKHGATEPREDFEGSKAPIPRISLMGPSVEATAEADRWLDNLLFKNLTRVVIHNNFILHFGMNEHQQLSRLMKNDVSIEECFDQGHASVAIKGRSDEDVALAWIQVEAILCNIQKEFVKEEEQAMSQMFSKKVSFERRTLEPSSREFKDRIFHFNRHSMLKIVKVDKVENATLDELFDEKKKQLNCFKSERMFQCIPVEFCEMVCRTGFQAEYAPPDDPALGEGIYFTSSVKKALEVWNDPKKEFLHFVEAEVVTGKSTNGKPGLILPPVMDKDLNSLFDSVRGPEISVIFSGYQALPRYIITCEIRRGG